MSNIEIVANHKKKDLKTKKETNYICTIAIKYTDEKGIYYPFYCISCQEPVESLGFS